ncbi:MAG: hypothetical protein ACREUA_08815 [Burkholderiales bacterium]
MHDPVRIAELGHAARRDAEKTGWDGGIDELEALLAQFAARSNDEYAQTGVSFGTD